MTSRWQDISTAPKDGSEILVCNQASLFHPQYVAYWVEGAGWLIWGDDKVYKTCDPTHWMPLPRLPGEEASPFPQEIMDLAAEVVGPPDRLGYAKVFTDRVARALVAAKAEERGAISLHVESLSDALYEKADAAGVRGRDDAFAAWIVANVVAAIRKRGEG